MSTGRVTVYVTGALLLAGLALPPVVTGAKPVFERIAVDDTFVDEELSEACDVPVTTTARGHITLRTLPGDGPGLATVNTINIAFTATAGGRTFRFRDVGADVARIQPDGTVVLLIAGQVPFAFAGALKLDPETEEVILEPKDRSEAQLAKACAALTG
jgi:hypothetical protein